MSAAVELPALVPLPLRAGHLPVREVIELYMSHYAGRDTTRAQRLAWWRVQLGTLTLAELSDDQVHAALEALANQSSRYFAGNDADGRPIFKAKKKPLAPATINRYATALAAVLTWSIKRRIAPKGYVHPCRAIERQAENNGHTRFLSDDERARLLQACRAARWPRLYLLVLMALTTGARKGELTGLRWGDVDLVRGVAHVARTKNNDPRLVPLTPAVATELAAIKGSPGELVFMSARNKGQAFAFEGQFAEALALARVKAFRFHDLRHSCASVLAQKGRTLLEIGDLLGHRQLQVTKRYSHLATGHKVAMTLDVFGELR